MPTYQESKAERDRLDQESSDASRALQVFPRGAMGITPDHIKASAEWQAANLRYRRASKALQDFNVVFTRQFAKELSADRDARRARLVAAAPAPLKNIIALGPAKSKRPGRAKLTLAKAFDLGAITEGTRLFPKGAVTIESDPEGRYAIVRCTVTHEQIGPMYATKSVAQSAIDRAYRTWEKRH